MKKIVAVLIMICMTIGFSMDGMAASDSITTPYEFTVKPGDTEWKKFQTTQEMIDATQIPEQILQKMTTSALLETMLSNSFIMNFYYYEDSYYALQCMEDDFNVYRELRLRPDYFETLKAFYEDTELVVMNDIQMKESSEQFFDVFNLEVLIAYEMATMEQTED